MQHTRVLIVDDSPTVCEFIARGLSQKGYQTLQAVRMEEALSYGGSLVDLVVTDIIMPGMDGYEGIQRIKSNWPHVPVIAMSAGSGENARDNTLLKARAMGADAIMQKPFTIDVLGEKIEYLLERRGHAAHTRVLVVEDSRVQREVIKRMFQGEGTFEVYEAETAEEAMESRAIVGVDLLVTDIFMPGKGGLACIHSIRNNWPNIRIIAISGGLDNSVDGDAHGERGLKAAGVVGADATLKKPFGEDMLFATVNQVLGREQAQVAEA
ncbi:response regulator [Pseudomonadota bacterium]